MGLVHYHGRGLASLLGQAAFHGDVARLVGHEDGAEHHLFGLLALLARLGESCAHAALEALHEIGRNLALAQQRIGRRTAVGGDGGDSPCPAIERHGTHHAERIPVLGHDGQPHPQHARVPVNAELLAGGAVGGSRIVAHHDAAVLYLVAVNGHEQVFATKHPQQVGALHHEAHDALLLGVEHETTHLADALRALLPADDAHARELVGRDKFVGHVRSSPRRAAV